VKSDQDIQVGDLVGFKNVALIYSKCFGTVMSMSQHTLGSVSCDGSIANFGEMILYYQIYVPSVKHPIMKTNMICVSRPFIYKIAGPSINTGEFNGDKLERNASSSKRREETTLTC